MRVDKKFENTPIYKEIVELCNSLPIDKVLAKMLEILNGGVKGQQRAELLHYELTKMKKCLEYAEAEQLKRFKNG